MAGGPRRRRGGAAAVRGGVDSADGMGRAAAHDCRASRPGAAGGARRAEPGVPHEQRGEPGQPGAGAYAGRHRGPRLALAGDEPPQRPRASRLGARGAALGRRLSHARAGARGSAEGGTLRRQPRHPVGRGASRNRRQLPRAADAARSRGMPRCDAGAVPRAGGGGDLSDGADPRSPAGSCTTGCIRDSSNRRTRAFAEKGSRHARTMERPAPPPGPGRTGTGQSRSIRGGGKSRTRATTGAARSRSASAGR